MASTRTAAKRRRARAMARQASLPRHQADAAVERDDDPVGDEPLWYVPEKRWPAVAGVLICLAGIAVAAYLTWAHYHPSLKLACPNTGAINCEAVTTSKYSHFLGLPVAVLGLAFFVGMLPLQLPQAWRSPSPYIRIARLGGAVLGVVMILWLIYAEIFLIGKICLYCTSVHVLTFLLFITTLLGTISTTPEPA